MLINGGGVPEEPCELRGVELPIGAFLPVRPAGVEPVDGTGRFPITHWSPTGGYTSPTDSFEHRYRGIVAAQGPMFGSGEIEGMSIVDMLPTIMTALGEPLSPEFDGEVRTDLLSDPPEETWREVDEVPDARMRGETDNEREERESVVEERLADLGYME